MSTALYRRYRPETFADVIGQEHVTGPLMAALDNGRVTHAYLFSGPRGCGKTTSARIFARCLNCAQGPTSTPCGSCDSCVELARGGAGSIDVVEMDAASHGGVDDARELRERAAFAPARDRYKVFIIDEAHMVSTQGFNALLKLVEEPPPHVKFVFATTEPEKVIGTIRSRTHHYPFRLVPPEQLTEYLSSLAEAEGVQVDSGVLPLVVRAGGGSVRDSLSVLDQLIAGTEDGALGYERAVALLGFTHGALLDDTVDALAARDGASLFRVVDRVIESGHAPRRFVEDLLERLRDLIVVRAAGEQAASVLRAVPVDQLERMKTQASHLPPATLSRAADLVNEALTEMAGATSPRLQLELLCARLLLPSADDGAEGFAARLDRLEGALGSAPAGVRSSGGSGAPAQVPAAQPAEASPAQPVRAAAPAPPESGAPQGPPPARPAPSSDSDEHPPAAATAPGQRPGGTDQSALESGPDSAAPPAEAAAGGGARRSEKPAEPSAPGAAGNDSTPAAANDSAPAAAATPAPAAAANDPAPAPARGPDAGGASGLSAAEVRRRWPEVLDTLARIKRTTWALISQDAQIVDLDASTLRLGFSTSGLASAFRNGQHSEFLQRALAETLGLEVRIEPVVADGSAGTGLGGPGAGGPAGPGGSSGGTGGGFGGAGGGSGGSGTGGFGGRGGPGPGGPGPGGPTAQTSGGGAAASAGWDTPAAPTSAASSPDPSGGWDPPAAPGAASADPPAAASGWDAPDAAPSAGSADSDPSRASAAARAAADHESPEPIARATTPPPWDVDEEPPASAPSPPAPARATTDTAPAAPAPPQAPQRPVTPPPPTQAPPSSTGSSTSPREQALAAAREARQASLSHHAAAAAVPETTPEPEPDYDPDPNDPDIESTGLSGAPLVARLLGGTVIDEILESGEGGDR